LPAFRAINPLGHIPVLLLHDGTAIPEAAVIVEFLDDAYLKQSLLSRVARNDGGTEVLCGSTDTGPGWWESGPIDRSSPQAHRFP